MKRGSNWCYILCHKEVKQGSNVNEIWRLVGDRKVNISQPLLASKQPQHGVTEGESLTKESGTHNSYVSKLKSVLSCHTPQETSFSVLDRKSTRLNSSHSGESRMPSSA